MKNIGANQNLKSMDHKVWTYVINNCKQSIFEPNSPLTQHDFKIEMISYWDGSDDSVGQVLTWKRDIIIFYRLVGG